MATKDQLRRRAQLTHPTLPDEAVPPEVAFMAAMIGAVFETGPLPASYMTSAAPAEPDEPKRKSVKSRVVEPLTLPDRSDDAK